MAAFSSMTRVLVWLVTLLLLTAGSASVQGVTVSKVPDEMRSKLGLYLMPKEAPRLIKAQKGKALFVDIRTRAEAQFLGMAEGVDALVPYVEFQEFMTDWDQKRGFYKLEPFSDFVPELERRL